MYETVEPVKVYLRHSDHLLEPLVRLPLSIFLPDPRPRTDDYLVKGGVTSLLLGSRDEQIYWYLLEREYREMSQTQLHKERML